MEVCDAGTARPVAGLALAAAALGSALDAVALVDAEGRVGLWNAAAEGLFGYAAEEALGRTIGDLVVPERHRARHEAGFAAVTRGGGAAVLGARLEVEARRRDGSEMPVELALVPLKDEAGGLWFSCTVRDVSERWRLLAEVEASAARFRHLVETVPGMAYEFVLYADGAMGFEYVSSGAATVFGHDREALLRGEPPVAELIHPEEREGFFLSVLASAEGMVPWSWEGRAVNPRGGFMWVRGESRPVRREDGAIVWYGFLHDTTAAHEARRELDEARMFLSATIDQMPDIVFLKDAESGKYVLFNAAGDRFFDHARGAAVGRDATFLFGQEMGEAINARDREIGAGTMLVEHDVPCESGGEARLLVSRKFPLRAPGTGHPYVVGVATDVTEARARERELVQTNTFLENRVRLRTEELRTTQGEILARLGRAAGYRDDDTGRHIQRMSRACAEIARAFGMPQSFCELLLQAAPMHDIGKIAVPDAILHKPGRLDDAEMAVMRTHAETGARMLAGGDSDLIRTAEEIALTHHERWDGTGYPRGLKGEAIPLAGRISAIADVYDALTSERPYKRAWSSEEAAAEIRRCAGTHFDPALVAAFGRALPEIRAVARAFGEATVEEAA